MFDEDAARELAFRLTHLKYLLDNLEQSQKSEQERELIKRLVEFPAIVAEATERRGPHALPVHAIRIADDFHRFYHQHRVLESDAQSFRLALCEAAKIVIGRSLDLIGVEAPERM